MDGTGGTGTASEPGVVTRVHAVGIDRRGNAEPPLEGTNLDFHGVVVAFAFTARQPLARDGQDAVGKLHVEVARAHPRDVHVHDNRVLRKLGLASNAALVHYAVRHQLVG